ncbi:uncharacterized protein FOMMEDRAFT_32283 [Fomitiporia mediterranea MF3/22]|uniref:uncharacterized protein n=1 Tax=Fomitiporia mediterranea (strain MF3/22) TaxID=694068 RepID=UPI0004407F23|nr:uncharacterized protein FOMMEDRAFT_32283 [Fomitiporia mediterranea MF3/22]EJC98101.1 hypothetical protein FOMMEDRAFT_32283 [Fomitiporia mediterranea MF3/22]
MYFSTMYDYQSSTSSSSSGVTTPVDGVPPRLVAFPKSSPPLNGFTSSGSSDSPAEKRRARRSSYSSTAQIPVHRPVKLSLESTKASPIPAIHCASEDYSPLGAFSLTSSAEGHLRSLVTRVVTPTKSTDVPTSITSSTLAKRERTSSLRSFAIPWSLDDDIEEEEETFWPLQKPAGHYDLPSISRSSSPPKTSDATNPFHPDPRRRFATARAATSPKMVTHTDVDRLRKPVHVRANSYAGPSNETRTVATLRAPEASHPPRTFLRPAAPKNKGKNASPPTPGIAHATQSKGASTLNPTLAAAESASRLRARCSRECRVSNAAAGSARHTCRDKNSGKRPAANVRPVIPGA